MGTMQRLSGKVAIITGAASGIGLASARLFAEEGACVIAVDRPESGIGSMFQDNPDIKTVAKSVTDDDAPKTVVDAAIGLFGGVDILFNNAGVIPVSAVEVMPDDLWNNAFAVNVSAAFRMCRHAIPYLRECAALKGRARIVNNASFMAGLSTDHGCAAYTSSKHAVAGLTKTLALELGQWGITVNYLVPGAIRTGMTKDLLALEPARKAWAESAALKRVGEPLDIARAALMLASDDADFITGHGLVVDGGLTLRSGPALS